MSEMKICDLCEMDGEETRAIGSYFAKDDVEYDVCKKHVADVKKRGLVFHPYDEEEEDE